MNPQIATIGCAIGIGVLFVLNRDREAKTSIALWLPVGWLLIGGSRNVSEWLQLSGPTDTVDRYLEGSPADRNVLTLMMALGVVALAGRGRQVGTVLRANAPVLVFFLYCGISCLWSDYPFIGFKRWMRSLGDVVMVLVILTDTDSVEALKRVMARVGFLLLPISILLIRFYPDLGRAYGQDGSLYWTGVATGKNSLGMICLIFGLAAMWRFLVAYRAREEQHRLRRLAAHGTVVAMATWLLLIADSKTSLACFVLVGGLMTITSQSRLARKPALLQTMVIGLVLGCFAVLFLGIGGGALEKIGRDQSLTGRTEIWNAALSHVENPLLGAGYESFWLGERLAAIVRVIGGGNQAHNGYIEIYLNLGWLGVCLLGGLILTGYRRIISGFRPGTDVSVLRLAYFVVAVVYNFTEGSFKMMSPIWIAFLMAIMGAAPSAAVSRQRYRVELALTNSITLG